MRSLQSEQLTIYLTSLIYMHDPSSSNGMGVRIQQLSVVLPCGKEYFMDAAD
jgi:hypothetical protein